MPASIPHKICDHFVHNFFQIGRLLSNRLETIWSGPEQYSENYSQKVPAKFEILFQKPYASIVLKWTVQTTVTGDQPGTTDHFARHGRSHIHIWLCGANPLTKDHLPLKKAFSGLKGWSLVTGFTVHPLIALKCCCSTEPNFMSTGRTPQDTKKVEKFFFVSGESKRQSNSQYARMCSWNDLIW